jgi:hypothetical protein
MAIPRLAKVFSRHDQDGPQRSLRQRAKIQALLCLQKDQTAEHAAFAAAAAETSKQPFNG